MLPIAGAGVGQSHQAEMLDERRGGRSGAAQAETTTRIGTIAVIAAANVLNGLAILAVVLIMDYLHLLSHAQALGTS